MRLIDADAVKKRMRDEYVFVGFVDLLKDFIDILDTQPTTDCVVPVRCKDCKFHHYDGMGIPYCIKDREYGWKDDAYCSYAERRTDE